MLKHLLRCCVILLLAVNLWGCGDLGEGLGDGSSPDEARDDDEDMSLAAGGANDGSGGMGAPPNIEVTDATDGETGDMVEPPSPDLIYEGGEFAASGGPMTNNRFRLFTTMAPALASTGASANGRYGIRSATPYVNRVSPLDPNACGDGLLDRSQGEECDGLSLGDVTCDGLGFGAGVPACTPDCRLDVSACSPLPRFVQVSLGNNHGCAIDTRGQIECWGSNTNDQALAVSGDGFVKIATADQASCAVHNDGSIQCWGTCAPPLNVLNGTFRDVDVSDTDVCLIRTNGDAICHPCAGAGLVPPFVLPAPLTDISVGNNAACALSELQPTLPTNLFCWGTNAPLVTSGTYKEVRFGESFALAQRPDDTLDIIGTSANADQLRNLNVPAALAFATNSRGVCIIEPNTGTTQCFNTGFDGAEPAALLEHIAGNNSGFCGVGTKDDAGRLFCWGQDTAGGFSTQLRDTYTDLSLTDGLNGGGGCVIDDMSALTCWGDAPTPDAAILMNTYPDASVTSNTDCAVTSSNTLVC